VTGWTLGSRSGTARWVSRDEAAPAHQAGEARQVVLRCEEQRAAAAGAVGTSHDWDSCVVGRPSIGSRVLATTYHNYSDRYDGSRPFTERRRTGDRPWDHVAPRTVGMRAARARWPMSALALCELGLRLRLVRNRDALRLGGLRLG